MVSFYLSKEMEKDVFCLVTRQKKKSESQWGNEPQTFKATETLWWVKPIQSSLMTCVLHTARISNVNRVMFVNRIRWYVMSLVKKKEKDVFRLVMSVEKKEKFWVLKTICCLICWDQSYLLTKPTPTTRRLTHLMAKWVVLSSSSSSSYQRLKTLFSTDPEKLIISKFSITMHSK